MRKQHEVLPIPSALANTIPRLYQKVVQPVDERHHNCTSSGPNCSPMAVQPARSANNTVTGLRCSSGRDVSGSASCRYRTAMDPSTVASPRKDRCASSTAIAASRLACSDIVYAPQCCWLFGLHYRRQAELLPLLRCQVAEDAALLGQIFQFVQVLPDLEDD